MKHRQILALLLVLSLLLCLGGCTQAPSPDTPFAEPATEPATDPAEPEQSQSDPISPLLYQVTDADGNTLWLFGSIHVGRENFYPLPDYIYDAYNSADALAVECDILALENDFSAMTQVMAQLVYTDGTTIRDHLPEELYDQAVDRLQEEGVYNSMLDYYMPIMWSSLLDSLLYEHAKVDSNLGVDRHLLEMAHEEGKQVLEVESVEFQYRMLASFSSELQVLLLESSLQALQFPSLGTLSLNAMLNSWAAGDAEYLASLLSTEVGAFASEEEQLLYQEYNDAMLVQRNISMTDYAEAALKSGQEVFICVGAAHVVGEGAMADLLLQRGYTVLAAGEALAA